MLIKNVLRRITAREHIVLLLMSSLRRPHIPSRSEASYDSLLLQCLAKFTNCCICLQRDLLLSVHHPMGDLQVHNHPSSESPMIGKFIPAANEIRQSRGEVPGMLIPRATNNHLSKTSLKVLRKTNGSGDPCRPLHHQTT